MSAPWTATIAIDAALATRLIHQQFPRLAGAPVEPFGEGWDNCAFRVRDLVFRFPRRESGLVCMQAELGVLPHLAGRLPLPIPNPTHVGQPTVDYPHPFAGYRHLDGQTADQAALSDAARAANAPALGHVLKTLHAISPPSGCPIAGPSRSSVEGAADRAQACIAQMPADIGARTQAMIDGVLARVPENSSQVAAAKRSLVHGDLYARHLLIDDADRLCGVIDWGDVSQGDPAIDLAIAWLWLPPSSHAAFRSAYGEIDAATWARAAWRAAWDVAVTLQYGLATHDRTMLAEGRRAIGFIESTL